MERAEIFELVRVRIYTVVEANRADGQLVTQTSANRIAHVVQPNVLGAWQQIASVSKHGALQFAENWECVFNIEDGEKFSANRMTVIIVRAKIAFAEAAYCCCSAVEKPFVDRKGGCLVGAAAGKRMNNAATRTKGDRRLVDPSLETTLDRLICNHTGRERFWSKRKIVADAHRAANEFDVATKRGCRHIDGVADKKATGVDIRALTEIECVRESDGVYLIVTVSQEEFRPDFRIRDFHMTNGEDERGLVIFRNFAAQFESSAQLKFCVAIVIESEGVHFRRKNKICVKEERILI